MSDAIDAMREAFVQLSSGEADVPLRTRIDLSDQAGAALFMPAYLEKSERLGLKVVTLVKNNPSRGLPMIHAVVLVLDAGTGRPLAVLDGERLTAIRTGAASGLATDLLARKDARCALIIGAGVQGRTQLEAVLSVRKIEQAFVSDSDRDRAKDFAQEMEAKLSIPVAVSDTRDALQQADIVCTATSSSSPVFEDQDLAPGTHINGVGSYTQDMAEIPAATIKRAKVVVDSRTACLAEAGDLIQPLREGLIEESHIHAELGEVASGTKPGRASDDEVTLFKSVGLAIQDLSAAARVLAEAKRMGLGADAPF
jgi:ornithine cyclodeaminase/alanine dehydrogenase-like protein (mu-crystallin family)